MPRRLDTRRDEVDFSTRSPLGGADEEALRRVRRMLEEIRREDWEAVVRFSHQYDDVQPHPESLTPGELEEAWEGLTDPQRRALTQARDRIDRYQRSLRPRSRVISDGDQGMIGEIVRPLNRVGCYTPGGQVPLPSTVLMTAYVAHVAGVEQIVVCSPPGEDGRPHPVIQAAASLIPGVELYGVGGVQAVGAMAYGAGLIPPVDLVAGPGNLYVTLAKKEVFGDVEIDLLAGPSEIAIVASHAEARPEYLASDLMSQAEHDPRSRVYLFSPDERVLDRTRTHLDRMVDEHPRASRVRLALEESAFVRTDDVEEAVQLCNELAPEHLELHLENAAAWSRRCRNAGAIFCGPFTPEPVGDYVAGPSHTLPTGGSARFFSPLSVNTFLKRQSLMSFGKTEFDAIRDSARTLAELESLPGHAKSLRVRE